MSMMNKKMTAADQANAMMNRIDSELDALSGKSKGATALFYKMSEELHEINDALGVKLCRDKLDERGLAAAVVTAQQRYGLFKAESGVVLHNFRIPRIAAAAAAFFQCT